MGDEGLYLLIFIIYIIVSSLCFFGIAINNSEKLNNIINSKKINKKDYFLVILLFPVIFLIKFDRFLDKIIK